MAPCGVDCDDVVEGEAWSHEASSALPVMWMASGCEACVVQVTTETHVADLKLQILDKVGVPLAEQRLFAGEEELAADSARAALTPAAALQLLRSQSDPRDTNLRHFDSYLCLEKLPEDLEMVRLLGKSLFGIVELHRWKRADGGSVSCAVKQMANEFVNQNKNKESNEWRVHMDQQNVPSVEDALTEIGILTYLSRQRDLPLYILQLWGTFADARCTYVVTEFAEGGELFGLAAASSRISELQIRTYAWQLLQAVKYLHTHHIGHRDISLENVLLKDGAVRLMDFGMAALLRPRPGAEMLRYCRAVGKGAFRAPECYVPAGVESLAVRAPAGSGAVSSGCSGEVVLAEALDGRGLCQVCLPSGAVPGRSCVAEVWGYTLLAADIFAVGICLFNLTWHARPWGHAVLSDPYFVFARKHGIEASLKAWHKTLLSPEAMRVLAAALATSPGQRPSAEECLGFDWFAPVAHARLPLHVSKQAAA